MTAAAVRDAFNGAFDDKVPRLDYTIASSLAGKPVPARPWLVRDWIPRRQVTLLSGDGGIGKSLLALQLQLACASLTPWLGFAVEAARSIGIYAEDDDGELHARLVDVAAAAGVDLVALDGMAWRSAVVDPCELVEIDARGEIRTTEYFERLSLAVADFGARLVILDAATNLYGGDELKRRQVNGFLLLLRRLAVDIDGAVVLLAHPSVQGMHTGSGLSGSTHWNNGVRSRLYLTTDAGEKDEPTDPSMRLLSRKKANYAKAGEMLRIRWQAGTFVAIDGPVGVDAMAQAAKADRVFLALLRTLTSQGANLSPSMTANNFGPTVMAKHPDHEKLSKRMLEDAMHRALKAGCVTTELYGPPSNRKSRLVPP